MWSRYQLSRKKNGQGQILKWRILEFQGSTSKWCNLYLLENTQMWKCTADIQSYQLDAVLIAVVHLQKVPRIRFQNFFRSAQPRVRLTLGKYFSQVSSFWVCLKLTFERRQNIHPELYSDYFQQKETILFHGLEEASHSTTDFVFSYYFF